MNEDQFARLIWMLEALRMEIRASALIQQRTGAIQDLPWTRQRADDFANSAGAK